MLPINDSKPYLGGVHLVDGNDELTHTESEGEESVLAGLAIFRDTSLELTSTSGNDEDSTISLRSTCDHVLDEVTVSRSINNLKRIFDSESFTHRSTSKVYIP